jgi:hypothetical protein
MERFEINIHDDTKFITSNCTSAARAVSQYVEDIEQVDCEIRLVSLVLLYALGLRANVTTIHTNSESGIQTEEKTIVTPGGPFVEGLGVTRNL